MPNIVQGDFSGGMSAYFDSTKTPANQYRIGLNTRIRSSGIEGSYRPIEFDSPDGNHQALFALDDKLILVSSGELYEMLLDDLSFRRISTPYILDNAVEYIYHQAVPAPNSFKVNGTIRTSLSTFPEAIVLQDGVNQPGLLGFNLSSRLAKTFGEWQFDSPEYVPIGKQMTSSGNRLFIVDPTGRKIYPSVSGRQLDFVLDFDSTSGEKRLDADGTFLSVATSQLVAIHPAQGGGIIPFTNEQSYTLLPDSNADLVFGEIYLQPGDLFPVGVVNHLSFTQANGQTVFVSPSGIQDFNQVSQQLRESNNNPFSAPIFEHLVLPITSTATASAGDYTFFAVSSKFGDGILVYDNQRQVFAGFDLVGRVKEFAVLSVDKLKRVFFITYSNQVFELPLYSGTRQTYHVILGEYNNAGASTRVKPGNFHFAFNNLKSSGEIVVETYKDKVLRKRIQQRLEADRTALNLLERVPQAFPLGEETETKTITFDTSDEEGFAWGVGVSCSANARLVSADLEFMTTDVETVNPNLEETPKELFAFMGDLRANTSIEDVCTVAVTKGKLYVYYTPITASQLVNDKEVIKTAFVGDAKVFRALSDRVYCADDARVMDYEYVINVIEQLGDNLHTFFLLGDVGYHSRFYHIKRLFEYKGVTTKAISGNHDLDSDYAKHFFSTFEIPKYYIYSTQYVDFYCFSVPLDTAAQELDPTDGSLVQGTPVECTENGPWANWLRSNIEQRNNGKFNIVLWHYPAYSTGARTPGYATFRWPMKRMDVDAVICGHDHNYQREFHDDVFWIVAGTGDATNLYDTTEGLKLNGHLELEATAPLLQFTFKDMNGGLRDRFTISA